MPAENKQRDHYETIHSAYAAHYYDRAALSYRRIFIFRPLLNGLDLNGADVADLACGDGYNSKLLKEFFPDARVEGFDISPTACSAYRQLVGHEAHECDLLVEAPADRRFDVAMIVGGLHHMALDLEGALSNIGAMLKPNGLLLAIEPNKRFFLNGVREAWYDKDHYFDAASERPLGVEEIARAGRGAFRLELVRYFGAGPAYFLILNSLILRVPLWLKLAIAWPLMAGDALGSLLPAPFHPAFVTRWRYTPVSEP